MELELEPRRGRLLDVERRFSPGVALVAPHRSPEEPRRCSWLLPRRPFLAAEPTAALTEEAVPHACSASLQAHVCFCSLAKAPAGLRVCSCASTSASVLSTLCFVSAFIQLLPAGGVNNEPSPAALQDLPLQHHLQAHTFRVQTSTSRCSCGSSLASFQWF